MTAPLFRRATRRLLFAFLLVARAGFAQDAPPEEDDVEVAVPPSPPPAAPSPAQAPAASAPPAAATAPSVPHPNTPPPSPPPATSAPEAAAPATAASSKNGEASVASLAGVPKATAPVGATTQPRSLVAEGSNYVRPIRRGLTWWGFVQAQYQQNQLSEDQLAPGGAPLNQDQFALRRARLRIDHGWEYAAATLETDATTLNRLTVGLRRAEASLLYRLRRDGVADDGVTPLFVLTAGVTDLPFGAELGESQRDRVFMERSVGSLALFPSEADVGVKLWGAYRFLNYAVAFVNGQPIQDGAFPRDPLATKDIVGHVGAHAQWLPNLGVDGGLSFYHGKGFSPGRDATKDTVTWVDENNDGFAQSHEFHGVTGSAAVPSQTFDRWALGLDVGASLTTKLGVSRLNAEAVVASNLDRGLLISDPILSGASARQTVLSLSLVQQVTDFGLLGFRAAYYDPNSDLLEQRAGVFHLKNESFWVLSPTIGVTLSQARLVAQYDFVRDHLGRDERGVPTDAANNQLTLRLQVDL